MARFDGVIFDMDGTLVESLLDFRAIREDLGVEPGVGILEGIAAMGPDEAKCAHDRLLDHEMTAARKAKLMPGARDLLDALADAGVRTALLTRNAAPVMKLILDRFDLAFDLAWSREDGPIKPEPDGVLRACRELKVAPARCACVGDFHYDVRAANAAGAVSVLLAPGEPPTWSDEADHVIARLDELTALVLDDETE